jgi:tetratricopeptide (TPR) repeat protein
VQLNDELYGFGYQEEFQGGEGIYGKYVAPSWFDEARTQRLIKFSDTLVIPGFSGGPLLNLHTGAVCGVIKRTLGEGAPLGGRAVPVSYAIDLFKLEPYKDTEWLEALSKHAELGAAKTIQVSRQDILLYDQPNNPYASGKLFGREELNTKINTWLDNKERVLLYGLAASGKTVLASTIAERRLVERQGKYLWLRLRTMNEEDVLDALTRRFTTEKDRQQLSELARESKIQLLSSLMERSDAKLWVIDDAIEGPALKVALQLAPASMSILITSRINYGVGKSINRSLEIGDISPEAALGMLVELSGRPELKRHPSSMELLKLLGFHPYSIEIAARQLSQPQNDIDELVEMIEDAPFDLEMPGDFAEQGRESMKILLDAVVASLKAPSGHSAEDRANKAALRVFQAFGAFFASGATIDLLSAYLHQKTGETIRALNRLAEISLVRQEAGTRFNDIHDLVFSYARYLWEKDTGGDYSASLKTIADFLEDHKQDFKLLASEMDNLLGTASQAQERNPDIFLQIVSGLTRDGYMDNRGHTPDLLRFLDHAIQMARTAQKTELLHYLLSKRGNAYYDRLELLDAERCYREALTLAPTWYRKMVLEAVLGKIYTNLKNYPQADTHFRQSEMILEEHNSLEEKDEYLAGKSFILIQKNVAAYIRKDYQEGKNLTLAGLALLQDLDDKSSEVLFKTNLGTHELLLGASRALEIHKQALSLAAEIGDQYLLATAYYGAAIDYLVLDEFDQARECLLKAKNLYEEYGDLEKLNQLKALAQVIKEGR